MVEGKIDEFMAITGADDAAIATQFIEMADGNLDTAISLFFENGGAALLSSNNTPAPSNSASAVPISADADSDAQLAERLQREAYQQQQPDHDYVRPPDEARHEVLTETAGFQTSYPGIGGGFEPLHRVNDMFDERRPESIFNQRLDDTTTDTYINDDSSDSLEISEDDDDDEYEYVEEPVIELDEDGNIKEYTKLVRKPKFISKEQKLALLFKPPFSIMSKLDLDAAKQKARSKQKWIMINIQDSGIFQCQALNRDLWSSRQIKTLVKKNFIFLQYQFESRNAQPYLQFYHLNNKDDLPHIAILDPITGERVKQWNRTVPAAEQFISEINEFLTSFSLDPRVSNPTVNEPLPKLDPTTLTEEQQMELAIQESLNNNTTQSDKEQVPKTDQELKETHEIDPFDTVEAKSHPEPPNKPGITTRVQIRTGDGSRLVRRFNALEDTVRTIYEVIKTEMDGFADAKFALNNHQREDLIDKLDMTIADAGLKNSSLLLEKIESE
ncbi:DNA protein crosslink repair co-factor UBX5 [Saccharomyces eubayanus]|uniref:DNA protein crosslink repair co-factor UBX5 n=1 Tax=Saccharomyces eubayanus TaxID=1080349 RepID=UPI0006C0A85C|nr:UBX5-like protein [Saccharomyces eubayanus]KOH01157.1 UBX5-like protein [Saccharomyces eubayanus]